MLLKTINLKEITMKKNLLLFASFFLLLSGFSCREESHELRTDTPSNEGMSGERLDRIDTMLTNSVRNKWITGAVGFIARDGKIIYDKAFGFSNRDPEIPMRTDAIFRIASQTKAITSVAVMMLFEEGKFLLDDPVSKYIPEFANPVVLDKFNAKDTTYTTLPAIREITIRDLLSTLR